VGLTARILHWNLLVLLVFVLAFALVVLGPALVLTGIPGSLARAATPLAVLARDRREALILAVASGLVYWLASAILVGPASGLVDVLETGLLSTLVTGPLVSTLNTAWPSYMLTCTWLAIRGRLPWSLMGFLADAHRRGVLRQIGAGYQFRHIEIQHRLATSPRQPPAPNSPSVTMKRDPGPVRLTTATHTWLICTSPANLRPTDLWRPIRRPDRRRCGKPVTHRDDYWVWLPRDIRRYGTGKCSLAQLFDTPRSGCSAPPRLRADPEIRRFNPVRHRH
jgi:hypothetical protein